MSQCIELDDGRGSTARICAARGFNCFSLRLAADDGPHEVLWSDPGFAEGQGRPSGSGIPLLFPFAGRIGGGRFEFQGRTYQLPAGDGRGNAIHGFVLDRAWQVASQSRERVEGVFHAAEVDPAILQHWPSDFRLRAGYSLTAGRLSCALAVENPGPGPLPCWLGTHPYFRLPLGPRGARDRCRVTVPASFRWELEALLPTGRQLPLAGATALDGGLAFSETHLDDVFGGLQPEGGLIRTTIDDPAAGRTLEQVFDSSLVACVVYNPPHREAICLEPYSALPDAFRLEAEGLATGLRVLAAGESFQVGFSIGWAVDGG